MIYDLYGYGEPSLGDQPAKLAAALGVEWVTHDSDYRGVTFVARREGGRGKLRIQANDLREGDAEYLQEAAFPECRYLLYVDRFDRPDEIRAALASMPQWRFLRRTVVD